jgi:hypothetical protein
MLAATALVDLTYSLSIKVYSLAAFLLLLMSCGDALDDVESRQAYDDSMVEWSAHEMRAKTTGSILLKLLLTKQILRRNLEKNEVKTLTLYSLFML